MIRQGNLKPRMKRKRDAHKRSSRPTLEHLPNISSSRGGATLAVNETLFIQLTSNVLYADFKEKRKKSFKTRIIIGVIEAVVLALGLGLWDYFSEKELHYARRTRNQACRR